MAIVQISKIINRTGSYGDLPQLSAGEIGFATDQRRAFIGNDLNLYPPSLSNNRTSQTELLTEHSQISFSQISVSGDTELYIEAPTHGQVLAFDSSKNSWVNTGVDTQNKIHLGNATNVKVSGGLPGYVLETDGAGNLNWVPKDVHISRITNITTASPAVITTETAHGLIDKMQTTIMDVVGMTYGTADVGQISTSVITKIVTGVGFPLDGSWNGRALLGVNGQQIGIIHQINSTTQLTLVDNAIVGNARYQYSLLGSGLISVTNNSKQVIGSGTTKFTEFAEGSILSTVNGQYIGIVDYVMSNSLLYLREPYLSTTLSNQPYHYTKIGSGVIRASTADRNLYGVGTLFGGNGNVGVNSHIWVLSDLDVRYIGQVKGINSPTSAALKANSDIDYGVYSNTGLVSVGLTTGVGTITIGSIRSQLTLSGATFDNADVGKIIATSDSEPLGVIKSISADKTRAILYKPATVQSARYRYSKIAVGKISVPFAGMTVTGEGTAFGTQIEAGDILVTDDGRIIGTVGTIVSSTELILTSNTSFALTDSQFSRLEIGVGYIQTTPSSITDSTAKNVTGTGTTFISSGLKNNTSLFTNETTPRYIGKVNQVTNQVLLSLVDIPAIRGIGDVVNAVYKIGNSINGTSAYIKVINSTNVALYVDRLFTIPFNAEHFTEYVSGGVINTANATLIGSAAPGSNGMVTFNKNGLLHADAGLTFTIGNESVNSRLTVDGEIIASSADLGTFAKADELQGTLNSLSFSQPNITEIGTLSSLSVTGNASVIGTISVSTVSVANTITTNSITSTNDVAVGGDISIVGSVICSGDATFSKSISAISGFNQMPITDITTRVASGWYDAESPTDTELTGFPNNVNNYNLIVSTSRNTRAYNSLQIAGQLDGNGVFVRNTMNNGNTEWNKLWHSGNDGSGSGLDADTLDGKNSTYFKNSYTAIVRRGVWSRIAKFSASGADDQYYGSVNVTFKHTRNYVVVGGVLLVTFGHANNGQLVLLGSHGYSQVKIRLVSAENDYSVYMEVLDKNASDGIDNNEYSIILDNINCAVTTYTTFTNGTSTSPNILSELTTENNQIIIDGHKVWHSGNDGAGSGLDADTLDGYNISIENAASTIVVRNNAGGINVGSIAASGNVSVTGNLVSANAISSSTLSTSGNVSIGGNVSVTGNLVSANAISSSTLSTSGNVSIGGNVSVTGGNIGTNSSPKRIWGNAGTDNKLQTYLTSALSVSHAATAGKLTITELDANADLNLIVTTGLYSQDYNVEAVAGSNYPVALAGVLEVFSYASMVHQRYWVYYSNDIYIRSKYQGSWTEWEKQDVTPAGAIMHFARSTPPNGWLVANGAILLKSEYKRLFVAIGTTFNINEDTNEGTFRLPDLRTKFVYGWAGDQSGRTFGSLQEAHKHFHGIGHASSNNNDDGMFIIRTWDSSNTDEWPAYNSIRYPGRGIYGDKGKASVENVVTNNIQRNSLASTNALYINPVNNQPYSTPDAEHGNPPNIALLPCIKY